MPEWSRNTQWRQGSVLTGETAKSLGLIAEGDASMAAVVISHDCDIANQREPLIEVIKGRLQGFPDGNYTHAKNVRKLHLSFIRGSNKCVIELNAIDKIFLEKIKLVEHLPDNQLMLAPEDCAILQHWLAARYRRSAFPDEFDSRLQTTGMLDKLRAILKLSSSHIISVYFDVDEGEELSRTSDEPYLLRVYLLYNTNEDPVAASQAAETTKNAISGAFKAQCCPDGKTWKKIELLECEIISDEVLTVKQARYFKEWRAEDISLRTDPQGPTASS